jgi:DNA repair exonuclease SbcCD nuclease subunit
MKFLHAADIHLDSPLEGLERYEGAPAELIRGATRRAFENLVQLAIREQVDFVVIAGDLYDGNWRDFNTGMFFIRQVSTLREAGIRVYLIAGNHDAVSTMTRKLRLPQNPGGDDLMLSCESAETRRLDDLGVAIHGRSFANQAEQKNLVPDYPASVPHWFNLGLLHTSLGGSDEHDTYAPCTIAELQSKGYQYWALGHIHKRSALPTEVPDFVFPPILYSGNIQGRHIRETGARGCFIVSVDDRHSVDITFHPLDVFRWEICRVLCANAHSLDDVVEAVRTSLRPMMQQNLDIPLGVRVVLYGATQAHQELSSHRERLIAEIRSAAMQVSDGKIWVEKVRLSTEYPARQNSLSTDDGPLAELVRYLEELPDDPEGLGRLQDELKDLAKKLPPELMQGSEGLRLSDIDWVRELTRELKPLLLDRLHR